VGYLNDNFDPTHSTHYCIHPWSIAHSIMSYIITQFHVYSLYIYTRNIDTIYIIISIYPIYPIYRIYPIYPFYPIYPIFPI
jgi:hypothetical protein